MAHDVLRDLSFAISLLHLKKSLGEQWKGSFHEVSFGASIQKQIEKLRKKRYQKEQRKWVKRCVASDENGEV